MVVIKIVCFLYVTTFHNNILSAQQASSSQSTINHSRHDTMDFPATDPLHLMIPPVTGLFDPEPTPAVPDTPDQAAKKTSAVPTQANVHALLASANQVKPKPSVAKALLTSQETIGKERFSKLQAQFGKANADKNQKENTASIQKKQPTSASQLATAQQKTAASTHGPASVTSLLSSSASSITSTSAQQTYSPMVVEIVHTLNNDALFRARVGCPRLRSVTAFNIFNYFDVHVTLSDIQEYIKIGNSPDATNDEGQTLLMLAVKHNKLDIVKYLAPLTTLLLIDKESNNTALHIAIGVGNTSAVHEIVQAQKNRKNSDLFKLLRAENCDKLTPVQFADAFIAHIQETKDESEMKMGKVLMPELRSIIALLNETEAELVKSPPIKK